MSETTTEDKEALERRNRGRLATAVAVAVLCLLGIVVVQQVRRFFNRIVRRTEEPLRLSAAPPVGPGPRKAWPLLAAQGRST